MKALILMAVLGTLALTVLQYKREKNFKKTMITLASFALVVSLAIVGNLTRPVIPLYLSHLVLVVIAWGGVLYYLLRGKYLWWLIASPIVTIAIFLLLELLAGSGHELPVIG